MAEMVLQARTLPEPLFRLIHTDRVKIREDNNGGYIQKIFQLPRYKPNT